MKKFLVACVSFLSLTRLISSAAGPEYLVNEFGPVDEASELPTPFTPLPEEEPAPGLFKSSTEPFLRDARFTLAPRLYFRSLENATGVNSMFAGGGSFGLTTGWLQKMLQFGVVGYTSLPIANNRKDGIDRTGLVSPDGDGFAVLGEAWAKLKFEPATIKVYRQRLELPFIHGDDSRMIPNTFEAYQLDLRPSEIFRLNLGYVDKIKPRNRDVFIPMSEAAGVTKVDRGTAFMGFVLGDEERTYLEAIIEPTFDLFSTSYAQAGHTFKFNSGFELRTDLQMADQRSIGDELAGEFHTQFYGAQVAGSYGGAILTLAYNYTASGAGIRDPWGADPSFTGLMISNFLSPGENAYLVGLSYNFEKVGLPQLTAFSNYVYGDLPASKRRHEVNATVDYRIDQGPFKNLWLRLRYARFEASEAKPIDDFRVILNYTITF